MTMTDISPAQLIADILATEDFIDAQSRRFKDFLRPHNEKVEALKIQLQDILLKLNEAKPGEHPKASIATGAGTAYLSTITSPSIVGDKTEYLDWVLEKWDERGSMLNIGAPLKAGLQDYMDANNGQLPPHIKTSSITRVNVRKA